MTAEYDTGVATNSGSKAVILCAAENTVHQNSVDAERSLPDVLGCNFYITRNARLAGGFPGHYANMLSFSCSMVEDFTRSGKSSGDTLTVHYISQFTG